MQSLQQQATTRSGVKQEDAFAIDEVNLYQRLGRDPFVKLSTNFYNRVYEDEQQWFRSIFANSRKEEAIQNQYEFFIQRMGGPPLYSKRKGHPALIGRHAPYAITEQAAVRWLEHMQAAIDSTPEIDPDSKKLMLNFLKYVISPSFPLHFCMILQQLCSSSCSPSSMCST
jgi:truncated hemoglobin YjbI